MMERNITSLISVIVPVYNVEEYIEKCIVSICRQTYAMLEIVLVDDGSTDYSGHICDKYAAVDKRVSVIHKQNGGLSDARNAGIEAASGEYIMFVDSDDYITEECIEMLYEQMVRCGADISVCQYTKDSGKEKTGADQTVNPVILDKEKALEALLYQRYFTMSAWAKLFKMDLWKEIKFPYGKLHEDVGTIYKIFSKSARTVYSDKIGYVYVQHENSIINSKFNIRKMDYVDFTKEMTEFIKKHHPDLYKAAVSRHFSACFQIIVQIRKSDKDYSGIYERLEREIGNYKSIVLSDKKARLINRMAALGSYFSIYFTVVFVKMLKG